MWGLSRSVLKMEALKHGGVRNVLQSLGGSKRHFCELMQSDFRTHFLNVSVMLPLESIDGAKAGPVTEFILYGNILGACDSVAGQVL